VASFVAVALVGVATLAALVIVLLPGRLTQLVIERQDAAAGDAAGAIERAYRRRGAITDDDVRRAGAITATEGGITTVTVDGATSPSPTPTPSEPRPSGTSSPSAPPGGGDGGDGDGGGTDGGQGPGPGDSASPTRGPGQGGQPGAGSGNGGDAPGGGTDPQAAGPEDDGTRIVEVPIVVDGRTVGTLRVAYPADGLPGPERGFASSLRSSILWAAAIAIVLATGAALVVARRLDRPLARLIRAARRLGAGDLSARVGSPNAPGEIGELSTTFDQMADALRREDEVRRALVADVAHELRTPVTILQASLEEMVDGTVPPETHSLSSLHDEVLRLARILQDLEALAAAQAAGLEMTTEPVDLARVAAQAVERLHAAFVTAEIDPRLDLSPAWVLGDPSRLDQVVTNLLTNAIKFTPEGGDVVVHVAESEGNAMLEVRDSGPGIPEEEVPHVFERFWRGHAGASTSGSGVGLAVVAELVRAHHGRIEVAGGLGEGARFRVLLPIAPV
jgi:signal transduction histidine kinase/DNA-binding transcriptional regulator YdaS (Cro superfamily)